MKDHRRLLEDKPDHIVWSIVMSMSLMLVVLLVVACCLPGCKVTRRVTVHPHTFVPEVRLLCPTPCSGSQVPVAGTPVRPIATSTETSQRSTGGTR